MISKTISSYPNPLLHIVFDSYIPGSIKGAERERRGSGVLELANIEETTRIPTQLDKFWGSSANKKHLQKFVANTALQMAKEGNLNIVLSGTVVDKEAQPSKAVINHQEYADIEPLKSLIEDSDSRIISHIHWSLTSQGYKTFVVLSNDTDGASEKPPSYP